MQSIKKNRLLALRKPKTLEQCTMTASSPFSWPNMRKWPSSGFHLLQNWTKMYLTSIFSEKINSWKINLLNKMSNSIHNSSRHFSKVKNWLLDVAIFRMCTKHKNVKSVGKSSVQVWWAGLHCRTQQHRPNFKSWFSDQSVKIAKRRWHDADCCGE